MRGIKKLVAVALLAGVATLGAPRAIAGPEELPGITSPTPTATTTTGPEELPGLTEIIVIVATSII